MALCYVQSLGAEAGSFGLYWEQGIGPVDPRGQVHNSWKGD